MAKPSASMMAANANRAFAESRYVRSLMSGLMTRGLSEAESRREVIGLLDKSRAERHYSADLMEVFLQEDGATVAHLQSAIEKGISLGSTVHPEVVVDAEHKALSSIIGDILSQKPFITAVSLALKAAFDEKHGHNSAHRAHRIAVRRFWISLGIKVEPSGSPKTWNTSTIPKKAA